VDTCYRHPDRETGLHCSNCGRPICAECMTHAAVGIRCPECAGRRTAAQQAGFTLPRTPFVTYALIAANIALFVLTNKVGASGGLGFGGGTLNSLGIRLVLFGPAVAHGQDYRLLSAAFIHYGILHIAVNMYALYLLGGVFERYAGHLRFAAVYFTSALAGSFGALILTPNSATAGASGAIFGVMGALFVLERQRGMALLQSPIGGLILINLIITFGIPGISIGGHVGGLIGGALVGFALSGYGRGHMAYGRLGALSVLGIAAIVVVAVAGSLAVAG
jgi:membrane associated rhomboid family serine protease/DNA-directed RNA polymerase subunit RPC12/RpoP